MSALYDLGREAFGNGDVAWLADTMRAVLVADGYGLQVAAATNASPIAVTTATPHGLATGARVAVYGVTGNLAANNAWVVTVTGASDLTLDGSTGSGAYVAGGRVVRLSVDQFLADVAAGLRVATSGALAARTNVLGVLDAADVLYAALGPAGTTVRAVVVYQDTGAAATSRLVLFNDGRAAVTVASAALLGALALAVDPLEAAVPAGATLALSNGVVAVTTAAAAAGARALAVAALAGAVPAGASAQAELGAGLPFVTSGGDVTIAWDNGPNRILKL